MTRGRVRKATGMWIWGWPLLILFPPLGFLWLLAWSIWLVVSIFDHRRNKRAEHTIRPPRTHYPYGGMILHDGHLMTPPQAVAWESGWHQSVPFSPQGAQGLIQYMDGDWAAINRAAINQARWDNAEATGLRENGERL